MLEVSCAVILHKGKILAAQRGTHMERATRWEFPGGKVASGETPAQCMVREIREELQIEIVVIEAMLPVEHHYPERSIRLYPFICRLADNSTPLRPLEHDSILWCSSAELKSLDWCEADVPIMKAVLALHASDSLQHNG